MKIHVSSMLAIGVDKHTQQTNKQPQWHVHELCTSEHQQKFCELHETICYCSSLFIHYFIFAVAYGLNPVGF